MVIRSAGSCTWGLRLDLVNARAKDKLPIRPQYISSIITIRENEFRLLVTPVLIPEEYLVKEKQEDIIPAVSALGYDSYLAAIKAIEDAGSTDTTAIRDALKNVEIDGVTGNITFNETGDANKDIAFIKTIKDGRFQFLTTTTVE